MRWLVAVSALVLSGPARAAGPELIDLVPANAAFVLGMSGFKPFLGKLDKLITEVDPTQAGIGAIVELALAPQLGLPTALDRQAAIVVVMANPKEVLGRALNPVAGPEEVTSLIVGSFGFVDEAKLAADLKLDRQVLQPGKVFPWKGDNLPPNLKGMVRDKRLYMGTDDKALASVAEGKRLREALTREQADILGKADVLMLTQPDGWADSWRMALKAARQQLPMAGGDANQFVGELFDALAELRYFAVGVQLDGGVGVNTIAVFPREPKVAATLGKLSQGGTASVASLPIPAGSLLFAQAATGNGQETSAILRLITLPETPAGMGLHNLFARADQAIMREVFASFWKQLQGDRLAVYQPKNPQVGQLAALAVLDSADPAAFLAEVRKVVRPGQPADLKFDPMGPREDRAQVEKLIKDLGSDDFDTREKATTQLTLIGRPALPFLETAMKSPDAEIARRSKELHEDITQGAAQKRVELLSGRLPYQVAPTLSYHVDAEKRRGLSVDVVRIQLDAKDETLAPKLRDLLGPDWDKIRLVRRDRKVVVLFGSDVSLLEETLANLASNEVGLARWPVLKEFAARADAGRKLEFHWSLVRLMTLTDATAERKFKAEDRVGVSSLSFSAAPDRLQLDAWMPATELRGVVHLIQEQNKRQGQ